MSVFPPSHNLPAESSVTVVKRAELDEYLEDQAYELEGRIRDGGVAAERAAEVASGLADVARGMGLSFLARRLTRILRRGKRGEDSG